MLQLQSYPDTHHLTQYILHRLLGESRRDSDREAAEQRIFSNGGRVGVGSAQASSGDGGTNNNRASIVYPQYQRRSGRGEADNPIRRYLDEAKEQIDVIDFRRSR